MTLPRLFAMYEHWAQYPPVHVTAALFAGVRSETKSDQRSRDERTVLHYLSEGGPQRRRPRPGNV